MNERIKQLAEQAVEETQLLMIMEYRNFESTLYEKFAELIIEDCIFVVDGAVHHRLPASSYVDLIREHFAVE
jgi:hypothetical protein